MQKVLYSPDGSGILTPRREIERTAGLKVIDKTSVMLLKNKTMQEDEFKWKRSYTIVLLLNAFYILLFYFLMQMYA